MGTTIRPNNTAIAKYYDLQRQQAEAQQKLQQEQQKAASERTNVNQGTGTWATSNPNKPVSNQAAIDQAQAALNAANAALASPESKAVEDYVKNTEEQFKLIDDRQAIIDGKAAGKPLDERKKENADARARGVPEKNLPWSEERIASDEAEIRRLTGLIKPNAEALRNVDGQIKAGLDEQQQAQMLVDNVTAEFKNTAQSVTGSLEDYGPYKNAKARLDTANANLDSLNGSRGTLQTALAKDYLPNATEFTAATYGNSSFTSATTAPVDLQAGAPIASGNVTASNQTATPTPGSPAHARMANDIGASTPTPGSPAHARMANDIGTSTPTPGSPAHARMANDIGTSTPTPGSPAHARMAEEQSKAALEQQDAAGKPRAGGTYTIPEGTAGQGYEMARYYLGNAFGVQNPPDDLVRSTADAIYKANPNAFGDSVHESYAGESITWPPVTLPPIVLNSVISA